MSNSYTPTKWVGGKTVGTAQVMNNIENGILNAHNRLDSINPKISVTKSLDSSMYLELPGGLIIQWGCVNDVKSEHTIIQLPISFSNNKYNIQLTSYSESEPNVLSVCDVNAENFKIVCQNRNSSKNVSNIYWFVIGC